MEFNFRISDFCNLASNISPSLGLYDEINQNMRRERIGRRLYNLFNEKAK